MAAVGADVEQLRKAAQTFRQKAEYLESTITQGISRQITESPWKGADADSFRNQWQSDLAPKVRQVVEALRKSADSLTRNANEQERASRHRRGGPAWVVTFRFARPVDARRARRLGSVPLVRGWRWGCRHVGSRFARTRDESWPRILYTERKDLESPGPPHLTSHGD